MEKPPPDATAELCHSSVADWLPGFSTGGVALASRDSVWHLARKTEFKSPL
jgi:hypothetical protein